MHWENMRFSWAKNCIIESCIIQTEMATRRASRSSFRSNLWETCLPLLGLQTFLSSLFLLNSLQHARCSGSKHLQCFPDFTWGVFGLQKPGEEVMNLVCNCTFFYSSASPILWNLFFCVLHLFTLSKHSSCVSCPTSVSSFSRKHLSSRKNKAFACGL